MQSACKACQQRVLLPWEGACCARVQPVKKESGNLMQVERRELVMPVTGAQLARRAGSCQADCARLISSSVWCQADQGISVVPSVWCQADQRISVVPAKDVPIKAGRHRMIHADVRSLPGQAFTGFQHVLDSILLTEVFFTSAKWCPAACFERTVLENEQVAALFVLTSAVVTECPGFWVLLFRKGKK
eukprot:1141087-Pelagomonas_calceolata.AAC.4